MTKAIRILKRRRALLPLPAPGTLALVLALLSLASQPCTALCNAPDGTQYQLRITASGSESSDSIHSPLLSGDPQYLLVANMKRLSSGTEAFSKIDLALTVTPSPPPAYGPPMWRCVSPPAAGEFGPPTGDTTGAYATGWTATYQHMFNGFPLPPREYIFEVSWGLDSSGNMCKRRISVYVVKLQITELADLVFADDDGGDLPVTAAIEGIDSIGTGAATLEVDSSSEANIRLTAFDVPNVGLLEHNMGTKYYVKDKDYQAAARGNGDSAQYTFFLAPGSLPNQSPIRMDSSGVTYDATQAALLDIEFDFHVEDGAGTVLTNSVRPLSVATDDFTFFDSEVKTVNIGQGAGAPYGPDADVTVSTRPGLQMRDSDGDGTSDTYMTFAGCTWHETPSPGFDDADDFYNATISPRVNMDCTLFDAAHSWDGGNKWVAHARGDWTAMITVSYGLKPNDHSTPSGSVTPSAYVIDTDIHDSDYHSNINHLKLNMVEQDLSDNDEEDNAPFEANMLSSSADWGDELKAVAIGVSSVVCGGVGILYGGYTVGSTTVGTITNWLGLGFSTVGAIDSMVEAAAFNDGQANVSIRTVRNVVPYGTNETLDSTMDELTVHDCSGSTAFSWLGQADLSYETEVNAGDKVNISLEASQTIELESVGYFANTIGTVTTYFDLEMKDTGVIKWVDN